MKRQTLIKSLDLWDFEKIPIFTGMYIETNTITPDDPSKEAFEQHVFKIAESGEEIFIPDNYSITKAIKMLKELKKEKELIEIEYKGKTEVNGKPFAKFNIDILTEEKTVKK